MSAADFAAEGLKNVAQGIGSTFRANQHDRCKSPGNESRLEACDRAVQTHGGYGYASEYHVERYFRETRVWKIAPISQNFILAYIAEKMLGLPRSY